MFRLTQPTPASIENQIAAAAHAPADGPGFLKLPRGVRAERIVPGFSQDHTRSLLGRDEAALADAKQAFSQWTMFDLGWVRVANPQARIEPSQIVAVEVRSLGVWTLNLSRITAVMRDKMLEVANQEKPLQK